MNDTSLNIFRIPVKAIQYGIPVGLYCVVSLCGASLSHWMTERKKIKHLSLFDNMSSIIVCSNVCTIIASCSAYVLPLKYLQIGGFIGLFTSLVICARKLIFADMSTCVVEYSPFDE